MFIFCLLMMYFDVFFDYFFFFFKQKTAYEMLRSLVGSEMCIRDRSLRPRNLGRPPDRPRPRRRVRRPAPRFAGSESAGVLASRRAEGRPRRFERAPRELPRRDARAANGARRRGIVGVVEGAARRGLPPARRRDA